LHFLVGALEAVFFLGHVLLSRSILFSYVLIALLVPICSSQGSYFVSPADTTYDALGLMKRINVQSAAAFADAREVLASGSRCDSKDFDKENKENIDAENETGTSKTQTKIMVRSSQPLLSVTGI
jgi:hypothetical protein